MESKVIANMLVSQERVNWRQVGAFLGLTFGITWGANLIFWLTGCYNADLSVVVFLLQWQMFVPASCAIVLQVFFFRDNPIQFRTYRERPRWFFYAFLLSAAVQTGLVIWVAVMPAGAIVALLLVAVLQVVLLLFVLVLRLISGREAFARAGLAGGRVRYWALFGLVFVLFFVLQAALNLVTGLGKFPSDTQQELAAQGIPGEVYPVIVAVLLLTSIFLDPIMSMGGGTFGEEYGWRGYLQGELVKLGKRRGVLLVGLIWAIWHYPIILMGRHTYPASALGLLLMAAFCVLLGFALGYAMLKAGSVWLAAYLHGLANTLIAYTFGFIAQPADIAISFGMGALGLACAALVMLALLVDPAWRAPLQSVAHTPPQPLDEGDVPDPVAC